MAFSRTHSTVATIADQAGKEINKGEWNAAHALSDAVSGGIPYFTSTTAEASSGLLAANALLIGGGAGLAPSSTTTGTGVLTALGVNVGSAGAFVTFNGALGTPSSGVATNLTGTAASLTAGAATVLATPRTIGGVNFDGSANIVPQTIQSVNEATDTTCFPLFITTAGTQSLQPLNNAGFIYDSNTNALTATTFVGALTGNATSATSAATLTTPRTIGGVSFDGSANIVPQTITSANEATDTSCFLLFITASGTQSLQPKNNTGLTYNSNTNNLGATTFTGALTGNATSATVGTTTTVADEATDTSCFINFTTAASGDLGVKTNANITFNSNTGLVTFGAAVTVTGNLTLTGTAANIALGSNFLSGDGGDEGISVDSSGNVTASGTLAVNGASISTDDVTFTAFAGATTLLTIGGTGASASMFMPSTLDTTSSTTGAIRTSGGISAAKAINVGTTLGTVGNAAFGTLTQPTLNIGTGIHVVGVGNAYGVVEIKRGDATKGSLITLLDEAGNLDWRIGTNHASVGDGIGFSYGATPTLGVTFTTAGSVVVATNIGIGTGTFGTNAVNVLGISNGTVPASSPANMVQFYSKDSSVGSTNATLAWRTEQAVEAIGTFTASHKLRVWINEVEYDIQLDAV